jgi:hypothetical protein
MGSRVLQTFECDRCRTTDEGPDSYWPKGWATVQLMVGSIGPPTFIVCSECCEELRGWLHPAAHTDGTARAEGV